VQLLPGDAVQLLQGRPIPIAEILTLNLPEAALLLREADIHFKAPEGLEDTKSLTKKVHDMGAKAVLLKGGHMPLNIQRPNEHGEPSFSQYTLWW
jgi:hydroxymethylpyrimidine/phosphomethylpyrimidine kinase